MAGQDLSGSRSGPKDGDKRGSGTSFQDGVNNKRLWMKGMVELRRI